MENAVSRKTKQRDWAYFNNLKATWIARSFTKWKDKATKKSCEIDGNLQKCSINIQLFEDESIKFIIFCVISAGFSSELDPSLGKFELLLILSSQQFPVSFSSIDFSVSYYQ